MIFNTTKSKLKHYNIPPTDENHELLRKAKAAIAASNPEQALELLSTLKLKTLDIEITALSARLADLERTQRFGTESYDTETREHNKINKSIIFLITALEKEIAQSFEFYDKIRAALKSRYETRLSQKLSNRQPVNLRIVPSTTGTSPQAANTFVQYSEGQIRGKLAEYYQDANGRLLLIGVPGAGKTTLLLQLELELLEQETTRIPVILNLARWNSTFSTLEDWIQEILPSEMGLTTNKKIAGDLIEQDRLILLLDGLDEIKEEDRQVCLEAIGIYGEDPDRHFIISSRIEEYKAAAKDAPVNSQVEVGTLKYEQLIEQLEKTEQNEGSKRLLTALKEDEFLREIAEIPFYFNTLQLLFARGKYLHEFNFSALDIEDRKQEIEQYFVSEMFRKLNPKGYDAQSITKSLGFFASRLKRANLVDFELIHLQYWWCRLSKWETIIGKFLGSLVSSLAVGVVLSLIVGLVAGLAFYLFAGQIDGAINDMINAFNAGDRGEEYMGNGTGEGTGVIISGGVGISIGVCVCVGVCVGVCLGVGVVRVVGLGFGLIFGLVGGLVGGLSANQFTGLGLGSGLVAGLVAGLLILVSSLFAGLVAGTLISLVVGLVVGLLRSMGKSFVFDLGIVLFGIWFGVNVVSLLLRLLLLLVYDFGFFLGSWLFGVLFGVLYGGMYEVLSGVVRIGLPIIITRENIKWSWTTVINKKNLVFGLVSGLGFGLIFPPIGGLAFGLVVGLVFGIIGQLENHNSFIQINDPYQRFQASARVLYFSILQHWHLRRLLYKRKLVPKKLVPFLNDLVECNILETTGASWRFRHRILQDYFADQWVETEFEPEQK